jgi:hypothetical protein
MCLADISTRLKPSESITVLADGTRVDVAVECVYDLMKIAALLRSVPGFVRVQHHGRRDGLYRTSAHFEPPA